MESEEKIVICKTCKGTGYTSNEDKCPTCEGAGRLLMIVTVQYNILDDENLKRKAVYG